ncbi:MAG: M20/M25/M40 family metallo-hydrolase, partial [Planctomycetota bacterium]
MTIRRDCLVAALGGCLLVSASAPVAAQDVSTIDRADVERIVSTLASDEMRGREAFSEDALRAAEFIAGEFAEAGLEAFDGADGHLQRFEVLAYSMAPARVSIDGQPLSPDRYQVRYGVPSIDWATGDAEVVVVGPDDDPTAVAISVANAGIDALVLIDPMHEEPFRTIAQMYRRPTQHMSGTERGTAVVALATGSAQSTYRIRASADVLARPAMNVVGHIPGRRSDEFVLFSAHYDHLGIQRALEGDSIANGANDNASGVTAVVSLAKHFAAQGTPERTLLFVAFTAEEAGGFGSRYLSSRLDPDQIVAMFNIEMIGKPAVSGPNTAWITGWDRSSFGAILQDAVVGTDYEFYADPYPQLNLFYRSDNATLAALGVPAHSISTTPIDVDR